MRTFHASLSLSLVMILAGAGSPGHSEAPLPPAQEQPFNPAFSVNPEGTIAVLPIDGDTIDAVRDLVQSLQQGGKLIGVQAYVYASNTSVAELILMGEAAAVQANLKILAAVLPAVRNKHLIVISASLHEISDSDAKNLGINLANFAGATLSAAATGSFGDVASNFGPLGHTAAVQANINAIPISNFVGLDEALDKSRVLVSSEVYAPNGSKAQIVNTENIPTFSTDISGNTMTQYQMLETSIIVIPNTMDYRPDHPEQSRVRVDINAKVSVISGDLQKGAVTAPKFSVKSFSTTRIMKADGQTYLMGTFTSDSMIKSSDGFPLLSRIPLIKYFFSKQTKTVQRNTAFLTLSVRLVPFEQSYSQEDIAKTLLGKHTK